MKQEQSIALSTQDHKLASLFFDRIIPLHSRDTVPELVRFDLDEKPSNTDTDVDIDPILEIAMQLVREDKNAPQKGKAFLEYTANTTRNIGAVFYQQKLQSMGISSVPIYHSRAAYGASLISGTSGAVEITLSNVPIIDTELLDWKQILDVRKDEKFKRSLRKFRLFINDNYQGKDKNYIQDSLLEKIDAYEEECKKHGLTLVTSSLTQLLDSKSLLGTFGIAATALLAGSPAFAQASLIVGSAVEIGKIVLHVTEKQLEFKAPHSEISYLFELKKLTSKK